MKMSNNSKHTNYLQKIRNIGIIAHIDAGKTTLTERILFYTQKIHRLGEVHEGTATMDYLPEEQDRGITITSACTHCEWNGHDINIIDTPGHVDFTIEVERSLRVLDGAVGVFCAVGGVEPQSETVWRQSEQFNVPKIAFINKVDRAGADFTAVLAAMKSRLNVKPILLTMPLGEGEDFCAVLDIVHKERLDFALEDQGQSIKRSPLSQLEAELVAPWREQLLETLAENDDAFLEGYLEGHSFNAHEIYAALRRATIARHITPVLCGSALRNAGVQMVLDAVCALLPAPLDASQAVALDINEQEQNIVADPSAPLAALVFKVVIDGGRKLAFLRLYAGTMQEGASYYNSNAMCEDRINRIYRLHADHREQLDKAQCGDIVAVVGFRSAQTGETYCLKKYPVRLESIVLYEPVITLALEPRNADESSKLDEALTRYTTEDPTLKVSIDEGSGHRMLSGMGELHLDVILERIKREYGVNPRAGQPQVVYRESIQTTACAEAEFDRELGKEHHYGKVKIRIEPLARGSGNKICFGDFFPPDAIADAKACAKFGFNKAWLDATVQGLEDSLQSGPLTGYPIQDVCVHIEQLEKREGASTVPGYHMAAGMALREAINLAAPQVLEPIMQVEISVPETHLGAAIGLFTTCAGRVENLQDKGKGENNQGDAQKLIQGLAPLAKLFGFSTSLRSVTQGRAGLIMQFAKFDTV